MSTTPNTGVLATFKPCWDTRSGDGLSRPLNVPWLPVRHLATSLRTILPAPAKWSIWALAAKGLLRTMRDAIKRIGGTLPENISPAEHIKEVEKRIKRSTPN